MPRVKLTKRTVAKLAAPTPTGKQVIHWDEALRGFGVLCSGVTSAKTYIAQRDLPDGRTRRVTIAAVDEVPLAKAKRAAGDMLFNLRQGMDPKANRRGAITLRQALEEYLQARKDLRPASQRDYRLSVETHLRSWLDLPLHTITPKAVVDRHRAIQAEVARRGRYKGDTTANFAMRVLRILWNHAKEDMPSLPDNPVQLRKKWHAENIRKRYVRVEQLPAFYAAVSALPNQIHRDYLLLLLFTGLRRSEAASLRWSDVDFGQRVIRLPGTVTKSRRDFDLPMSNYVHDLLVARRALGETEFVFPSNSASGYFVEPQFPLNQVAKTTGSRVSAHDLRRTFVNACALAKIDLLDMKRLVNHALGKDGKDVTVGYMQLKEIEELRELAQRACDKLKELCGIVEPVGVAKLR